MIAVDTSSLVAYLEGELADDTVAIDAAIKAKSLRIPGPVITELLSYPKVGAQVGKLIEDIPPLETAPGFWERAGETRRKLLSQGFKARVENVLIAQLCLDQNILLITRAPDFRHFVNLCGLRLA
jgi:predicted nucleic acid-binding protein